MRANESVQVIADIFKTSYICESVLGNNFDAETVIKQKANKLDESTIFLVCHEPTLCRCIHDLVGKMGLPNGITKASACIIKFENELYKKMTL